MRHVLPCLLLLALASGCSDADAAPSQASRSTYWSMTGDYSGVSIWVSDEVEIQGHKRRAVSMTGHVAGNPRPLLASYRYVDPTSREVVLQEHEDTSITAQPADGLTWGQVTNRRQLSVELEGYP